MPSETKFCALTFDDGPGYGSTSKILNVLAKYNIKATWFVLGSRIETNKAMAQRIVQEGHEIANHSYSHANLTTLSQEGYKNEINVTQNLIYTTTGAYSYYLLPPYGSYTNQIARDCGLQIALWNVDSLDWSLREKNAIYTQVMNTMKTNSVVLFHDIYNFSAEAIELIVPALLEQGYTFVTYPQYLQIGGS